MKQIHRYIALLPIVLFCLFTANVQSQPSAANITYFMNNSVLRTELNPALQPERGYLNIMGIGNIMMNVNAGSLSLDRLVFINDLGNPDFTINNPTERKKLLDGLDVVNNIQADVVLQPIGIGFYTGKIFWTLNANIKNHLLMQVPKQFFEAMMSGTSSIPYSLKDFNYSNTNYMDIDFGTSFPISKYITIGGKFKYIRGIQLLDMNFNKLDLSMNQTQWNIEMNGQMRSSMSGYQGPVNGKFDVDMYGRGIKDAFKTPAGSGYGFDIGFVLKPFKSLSLSLAAIDIGSISWAKQYNTLSDISYNQVVLDSKKSINNQMKDLPEPTMTNVEPTAFTTQLPTLINAGAEWSIWNDKVSFGLLSSRQTGAYKSSQLTFSANLKPMRSFNTSASYTKSDKGFSAYGAALNWTPSWFLNFFVATDYIASKVTPDFIPINSPQMNVQLGVTMPLDSRKVDRKKRPQPLVPMDLNAPEIRKDTVVSNPPSFINAIKSDTAVFKPKTDSVSAPASESKMIRIDSSTVKISEPVNGSKPLDQKNDDSNKQMRKPE